MVKDLNIFFLVLFHISVFILQGSEIRGIVKDIYNQPVEAVTLQLLENGAATLSDHDGKFSLDVPDKLPGDDVSIRALHRSYHPFGMKVRIGDGTAAVNILLIPRELIKEEISVTALNKQEQTIQVPMAESSLSELDIKEQMPENVVDTLGTIPGIHFIGKGGFSTTPSIRGLARRRVLILVDGARLSSDRRVGVSASFIPPEMIRRIEVVRSSSSVLYGSDAIGGVVQIFTAPDTLPANTQNNFHLNMNTNNQRFSSGISLQKKDGNHLLSAGFNVLDAGDYASPRQEIRHSGFTYYSGAFTIGYFDESRHVTIGYLGGFGRDIGKPTRENSAEDYSTIPSESEQILRLKWIEKNVITNGNMTVSVFVNPSHYDLENVTGTKNSYERSITDVTNLGVTLSLQKSLSSHLSYHIGLEWFSRQNLKIENIERVDSRAESSFPLTAGQRNDLGFFATLDYSGWEGFDIIGGFRYSNFSIEADMLGERQIKSSSAPSAFLGITRKLGTSASFFLDIGKAFRLPSLSECFYTGITGRKYVVGNPLLRPEKSVNVDAGLKVFSESLFLGVYGFAYSIEDLIERFRDETGIYTYDNVANGRITGIEGELQYFPSNGLELFGNVSLFSGKATGSSNPLNDIPAARIYLGCKVFSGKFWAEVNYLHSFAKKDPGPAEILNQEYDLLNLKGGYYFSANLFLFCRVSNVSNSLYYANPDPDIPEAPGTQISTGVHFYF